MGNAGQESMGRIVKLVRVELSKHHEIPHVGFTFLEPELPPYLPCNGFIIKGDPPRTR